MKLNELLEWLKKQGITLAERNPQDGGEVLVFTGQRPPIWDGRPQWCVLPIVTGQNYIAKKEIEAILRHFCQGQLAIPKATGPAAIAVQPLHSEKQIEN